MLKSSATPQFKSINSSALSLLYVLNLTFIHDYFMVQISNPYITTRKTIILTRKTCVSKVISLLFKYAKFVIASLPRIKCLLISWLQSPPAVILEPKKIKSLTVTIFPLFAVM